MSYKLLSYHAGRKEIRAGILVGDHVYDAARVGTGAERGIFLKSGQTLKLWIQDIGELVHKVV